MQKADGYKGIWFTLGQRSEYGDKYSGGLGTYTAKHRPLAIYAEAVNKSFFVYGGTTSETERHLLCMIGVFNHNDSTLSKPTIVFDKQSVDDPHDNPSLAIDQDGYLWVFVSGRNTSRMGYKFKSSKPYSIESFERISEEDMTYPQPWYIKGKGFFHFFTKYTGTRELYFETSRDGKTWSEDVKLAGVRRAGDEKAGHYQVSDHIGDRIITFFNWHPNGDVDQRTDLYFLQTHDMGKTWTTITGKPLPIPIEAYGSSALISDYFTKRKNVYLKDVGFDEAGNPVCLYILSGGHQPGPKNDPREWRTIRWDGTTWQDHLVATSDHNYDMGSLIIDKKTWTIIAPFRNTPQRFGAGGELVMLRSIDKGITWKQLRILTNGSERNHNYVRKVVNGKDPFQYFWADGNPDSLSISKLYFGDSEGNVRQMPYRMKGETEKGIEVK
ncbi:MAG TPA: BNR-4 repeat-containing protein [Chryseolinea sp.]